MTNSGLLLSTLTYTSFSIYNIKGITNESREEKIKILKLG